MKTYLRHRIVNVVDIKELIALEYLDFDGKYKNYSEAHDFWELCYICQGKLRLKSEQTETELSEGEALIISPGRQHCYRASEGGCCAYVICFESQSQALRALSEQRFTLSDIQRRCIDIIISEATGTFETNENDQLKVIENPNFGGQQAIISQLEYLFICMLRQVSAQKNANVIFLSDNDFYEGITKILLNYFKDNINDRLNLDKICKKINYSRSFLCKIFKEQTGQTLIGCFNKMKIEYSQKLLEQTDRTIAQIASELGYSDTKYFNTVFKKQTGITPSLYRKSKRGEKE